MERDGGRVQTPSKLPKNSFMAHAESLVKGFVRKVDLENLNRVLEKSVEGLVKTLDRSTLVESLTICRIQKKLV